MQREDENDTQVVSMLSNLMLQEKPQPAFPSPPYHKQKQGSTVLFNHPSSQNSSITRQRDPRKRQLREPLSSPEHHRSLNSDLIEKIHFNGNGLSAGREATDQMEAMGIETKDHAFTEPDNVKQTQSANDRERQIKNLITRSQLASLYHQSGELQQARRLYEEVIQINAAMLKWTVPEGWAAWEIAVKCERAVVCLHEGHFKEAENTFANLEMTALGTLGQTHQKTWEVSRWLGISLDKQGQYSGARDKLRQELDKVKRAIEASLLPYTVRVLAENASLLTKNALALVLGHMGEFGDAIDFSNDALYTTQASIKEVGDRGDREERERLTRRLSGIQSNRAAILAFAGDYKRADTANRDALKTMEKQLGTKHVATLDCWSLGARLLAAEGKIDQAEEQCHKTLQGMRREIGKAHPSTLQTLGILVSVYTSQARLTEARNTAKYLLDMNQQILGLDHPQTISSMNELAAVYVARGELREALSLQEKAVGAANRVLGKTHPATLIYSSNLASIHCNREEWEIAKDITHEVFLAQCHNFPSGEFRETIVANSGDLQKVLQLLRSCEELASRGHPSLFSTMHCLGISERDRENGDVNLALAILTQAVEYREHKLGPNHADTLSSRLQLAITQRQKGELISATENFETVLAARKELLGDDHPDSLSARHELSFTRFLSGYANEVAQEQTEILQLRILLFGENHPDTIRSRLDLSLIYHSLGVLDEARKLQLEALKSQLQLFDPNYFDSFPVFKSGSLVGPSGVKLFSDMILKKLRDDAEKESKAYKENMVSIPGARLRPQMLSSIRRLASIYADQGNYEKAIGFQQVLVLHEELDLGPDDLATLGTLNDLALMYQATGRVEYAKKLYKRVKDVGPMPSYLSLFYTSQSNLASLYFSTGEFQEAESLQTEVLEKLRERPGPDDSRTLISSIFNLALTKKTLGKIKEARTLLEEAVQAGNKALPQNHPQNIELLDTLQKWLGEQGTPKGAPSATAQANAHGDIPPSLGNGMPQFPSITKTLSSEPMDI